MSFYGSFNTEEERAHSRASRHLQTPVGNGAETFDDKGLLRTIVRCDDEEGETSVENTEDTNSSENSTVEEEKKTPMTRRQLWTIICMAFANFSVSACFGILAPFFPQEANSKGVDSTVVGLIFGGFELVIFIASPIFGIFLTKIGAKFMFVSGIFIGAGCVTLFGFLDMAPDGAVYIAMCFTCRSLEAVGCSMFVTASFAIVAYEFPGQVAMYIGFLETFSGVGMMVSPALGGVLYDAGGFKLPFIVMGGLMFMCSIMTYILLPSDAEEKQPFSGSMLKLVRIPSILVISAIIITCSVALGFLDPTLANHIDEVNGTPLSSSIKGVIFLVAPGVYGLSAPILGAFNDKFGFSKTMMVSGLCLMFLGQFFMGPSPLMNIPMSLWLLIVSLVPYGLGVGLSLLPTFQECIDRARANGFEESLDTYGLVSGIFNSCFSLGAFIGPTVGGLLNENYGFPWASSHLSFFLGGMAIFITLFYVVFTRVKKDPIKVLGKTTVEERQNLLDEESQHADQNGVISHEPSQC